MWRSAVEERQQGQDDPHIQLVRHAMGNTAANASRSRIFKGRPHHRTTGTASGNGQRCRRRDQDAGSEEKTVWKLRQQESCMTAKGLRKCRAVDRAENQKTGFPSLSTSPWKSLSRFPHSRSPDHYRHGKAEIQKQDSRFSTATSLSLSNKPKNERRSTPARNLVLQAHLRIGICLSPALSQCFQPHLP